MSSNEIVNAVILVNSNMGKQMTFATNEIIGILCDSGFQNETIRIVDVVKNEDLHVLMRSISPNGPSYPFVFSAKGHPIGDLNTMKTLFKEKKLNSLIDESNKSEKDVTFSLGIGDHWLNGLEWVLRTVTVPLSILTPKNAIDARKRSIEEVANKGPLDVDFAVLRTNWYWRHQKRIYRLTSDGIIRIRPEMMEKCDYMMYDSIEKLTRRGEKFLMIEFKEEAKHSPEYIESVEVDAIVRMILGRCGEKKPIVETK